MSAEYDCRACGACCHGGQWVPVESTDDTPEEMTAPGDRFYPAYMRMRCVALAKRAGRYRCTIYADRPSACRDFEPGSDQCIRARDAIGVIA